MLLDDNGDNVRLNQKIVFSVIQVQPYGGDLAQDPHRFPLTLQGDWQFSVERLDDSVGYVKENVVLIALEVQNGHCKWSPEFANEVWPKC